MAKNAKKKRIKKDKQKCNCAQDINITIQNDSKYSLYTAIVKLITIVWPTLERWAEQLVQMLFSFLNNL